MIYWEATQNVLFLQNRQNSHAVPYYPEAHLSVCHAFLSLAGRPWPAAVPFSFSLPVVLSVTRVSVSVVAHSLCYIALLVHRTVMVMMMVVMLAVFGAASIPVTILVFGCEVTWLGGCAQVGAQAWWVELLQGLHIAGLLRFKHWMLFWPLGGMNSKKR